MIQVRCKCGELLGAAAGGQGGWGRCPICGRVLRLPRQAPTAKESERPEPKPEPQAAEASLDTLCPQCHVSIPRDAVLCAACGADLLERRHRIERYHRGGARHPFHLKNVAAMLAGLVLLGALLGLLAYLLTG